MKISQAINLPLCLSRYFRLFFSTLNEFLDIVSKFVSCRKIRRKYLDKTLGKVNCPAKIHYCTVIQYQTYINSYCNTLIDCSDFVNSSSEHWSQLASIKLSCLGFFCNWVADYFAPMALISCAHIFITKWLYLHIYCVHFAKNVYCEICCGFEQNICSNILLGMVYELNNKF